MSRRVREMSERANEGRSAGQRWSRMVTITSSWSGIAAASRRRPEGAQRGPVKMKMVGRRLWRANKIKKC